MGIPAGSYLKALKKVIIRIESNLADRVCI